MSGTSYTLIAKTRKKWHRSVGEARRSKGAWRRGQTSLLASWRPSCAIQSQMYSPDVLPLEFELRGLIFSPRDWRAGGHE